MADPSIRQAATTPDGRIVTINGAPAIRFERVLPHATETVWAALVAPDALAGWLQAKAVVDSHVDGRFHLTLHGSTHAMRGRITAWERPTLLEYTWPEQQAGGDSIVRFTLSPEGDGCRLLLTHILRAGGDLADFASGWHWHLDALDSALLGEARQFDRPRWAALRDMYRATLDSPAPAETLESL